MIYTDLYSYCRGDWNVIAEVAIGRTKRDANQSRLASLFLDNMTIRGRGSGSLVEAIS